MFDLIRSFAGDLGAICAAMATGAAFTATVVSPNISYDRLDASRADGHVRSLLVAASAPLAGLLLAATAFGVLAGHIGAAVTAGIAAFGFFTNRWTLAPRKPGEAPPGVRQRRKSQRTVAVAFSLIFLLVALTSAVLGAVGL